MLGNLKTDNCGRTYRTVIFSGFTDGLFQAQERGEVQLITLEDLYK